MRHPHDPHVTSKINLFTLLEKVYSEHHRITSTLQEMWYGTHACMHTYIHSYVKLGCWKVVCSICFAKSDQVWGFRLKKFCYFDFWIITSFNETDMSGSCALLGEKKFRGSPSENFLQLVGTVLCHLLFFFILPFLLYALILLTIASSS